MRLSKYEGKILKNHNLILINPRPYFFALF